MRNFLESNFIHNYFPIDDYLFKCHGKWDGKDHIRNLARTVPTDNPYWEDWFYTWFIAMVDQWRNYGGRTYGNSVRPLLISKQGFNKSTFCRGLYRKNCNGATTTIWCCRKNVGTAGHVAVSAYKPRRVQPDFGKGTAGISEEPRATAQREDQDVLTADMWRLFRVLPRLSPQATWTTFFSTLRATAVSSVWSLRLY